MSFNKQPPWAIALLEQHAASNVAAINFTGWYRSAYDEYMIDIVDLVVVTTGKNVQLQFSSDGGATYDTGNNYGWSTLEWSSSGSGVGGNSGSVGGMGLMRNVLVSAGYSVSGSYRLFNPGGSDYKKVVGTGNVNTSSNAEGQHATGIYRVTTAVNAFRINMSDGSLIASGTIRVYGLAKSFLSPLIGS